MENFARYNFLLSVDIWGGVILTILTIFKAKKQHSVNTEHQLKPKPDLRVKRAYMKLNKMVQDQWLQQKKKFLLGYYLKIVIQWGQRTFGGGRGGVYWDKFWLVRGTSLHHPSRKNPV